MLLIPPFYIALVTGLAGLAWIVYARSEQGRYHAKVLAWLSLPFFALSVIYLWYFFTDVHVDLRAMYARFGIMSVALSQAIILFILSYTNRGIHGPN